MTISVDIKPSYKDALIDAISLLKGVKSVNLSPKKPLTRAEILKDCVPIEKCETYQKCLQRMTKDEHEQILAEIEREAQEDWD